MKKIAAVILFWCMFILVANAQPAFKGQEKKAYKKAEKYNKKSRYSEAVKTFEPVLLNHRTESDVWDIALKYYSNLSRPFMGLTFTVSGANDDLSTSVYDMMKTILNSKGIEYYKAARQCALMCEDNHTAQVELRSYYVDNLYPVDTNISLDAEKKFRRAEMEFSVGNFTKAAEYYREAIDIEPDYYKATLYLGDAYYHQGKYEKAIEYYQLAAEKNPNLMEPHKYITDAYILMESYEEAYNACVNALLIYPDASLFDKLYLINKKLGNGFNRQWISRNYNINNVKKINEQPVPDPEWSQYTGAVNKIKKYCDTTGIITKDNDLTESKYLEVYSWERLLKTETDRPEFAFARKMQREGYLDCYVLISLFHVDLYDQYRHFVKNNPDKVKEYLKLLR